jgi:hypothetical protein
MISASLVNFKGGGVMSLSGRAAALVLFLLIQTAWAQWDKRPYTQWTEKESLRVLDDSPWGQTQVFSDGDMKSGGPATNGDPPRAIDQGGSRVTYASQINFRIRLLSARPVRQAIARLMEINRKGDLNPGFAAKLRDFTAEESADYIIISVLCDAPRPSVRLQKASELLDSLTTEKLKEKVYLILSDGRRLSVHEYQPPGQDGLGARFIFLRKPEGKPIVADKRGMIRFRAEISDDYTLDQTFNLKNMTYQGRLEY